MAFKLVVVVIKVQSLVLWPCNGIAVNLTILQNSSFSITISAMSSITHMYTGGFASILNANY